MIADLKPYAEYKESGLPWLGQVPGHWEVKRAKSIFERIDERSKTGKEELLTVSSARGIVPREFRGHNTEFGFGDNIGATSCNRHEDKGGPPGFLERCHIV